MRRQVDVMVVAQRISLNMADWLLDEAWREGIFPQDEFIGSFGALDACPRIIAFVKTDR